jgi:hypothetical protein
MCEINPKRKQSFVVEFFSAFDIEDKLWTEQVFGTMVELEMKLNERGNIRCHVHTDNKALEMVEKLHPMFMEQAKQYLKFAEGLPDCEDRRTLVAKATTLHWVMENLTNLVKEEIGK